MGKDRDERLARLADMAANDQEKAEEAARDAKIAYRALADTLREHNMDKK
ncbi:MAG TPA: hypothetical protein VHK27_03195 [Gammaproteobacteria bacterium]|nr:hypothetical protein [Gammaproteobacteria bacterium]